MTSWSDISFHPTNRVLRQFAGAWLIFFLTVGALQYFKKHHPQAGLAFACVAVAAGIPGLIKPQTVRWLLVGSTVLAFPIGWLLSLLMLLVMFYVVITPVALLFRLRGRDLLHRKPAPNQESFWIAKETPVDVRSYFRQY